MNVKSMLMPPNGAEKLASRLEPPEYGTTMISLCASKLFLDLTHGNLVLVADLRKL